MPIEVTLSRDLMPSLTRQQGDVLIYQAADGGELAMQGGVLALTGRIRKRGLLVPVRRQSR